MIRAYQEGIMSENQTETEEDSEILPIEEVIKSIAKATGLGMKTALEEYQKHVAAKKEIGAGVTATRQDLLFEEHQENLSIKQSALAKLEADGSKVIISEYQERAAKEKETRKAEKNP